MMAWHMSGWHPQRPWIAAARNGEKTMNHEECQTLFEAGKTLLVKSRLVQFDGQSFVGKEDDGEFEQCWGRFHERFGRYMAWVWFSVGAENLAKAALICNEKLERKKDDLGFRFYSPGIGEAEWVDEVLKSDKRRSQLGPEEAYNYNYRNLGDLVCRLGELGQTEESEKRRLKATYRYLSSAIRNRDAHTYVEDVRRKDFPAVSGLFVPAFNALLKAMDPDEHSMAI